MQPASGRGELAVQRPLGDPHDAVVMGDQCAYDSLLRFEAGVRCARGRLAEHQLQYAADDFQVGGFGPITDWVLRAGRDDFGLFEQCVVLVLQLAELALGLLQGRFEGQALDQHGLPGFQRDGGMGDALAAREEKAGALFGVVLAHPTLQIDVTDSEIRGVDQRGVVRRDAVPPERKFRIEDAIVDAFGIQPQLTPTWAIQRLWQVP